jgi:hypothetical protein
MDRPIFPAPPCQTRVHNAFCYRLIVNETLSALARPRNPCSRGEASWGAVRRQPLEMAPERRRLAKLSAATK